MLKENNSKDEKPFRIIVVDDDAELRGLLQRYLTESGYSVRSVPDGESLDRALQRSPTDAIVLDLMMRGEDGLSICRRLRSAGDTTPILMLTARGDPVDRILGLEMGADDYLAKPFTPRELLARIAAILRRTGPRNQVNGTVIHFGPFVLDMDRRTLSKDSRPIELSSREFSLLSVLATHAGKPLSRAHLIELALGRDAEVTDRAIDVQVARLRKTIEDNPADPEWIKTIWGYGYVLARESGNK